MSDSDSTPAFADLGLPERLLGVLSGLGYEQPSPIQAAAIPELLAGRDVLGMAQTGTGKTAAFALPLVAALDEAAPQKTPSALVMTPTRELAQQVAQACRSYAGDKSIKVASVYGGAPYGEQIRALKGGADIVVGTPGRLMDMMRKGHCDASAIHTLVLDEADEMLRMGFIDDVEWVLEQTPPERQIALFSATMPPAIARIASKHLKDPVEVRIAQKAKTASTIRQRVIETHGKLKTDLLARLLETEDTDAVMVFVRTKAATSEVADALRAMGFAAEALSGDLSQEQREQTVRRLKSSRIDVVVATDVAARGLDVERISHVINYDIPMDPESYVHRIGRTGRAGRSGQAILFVTPRDRGLLRVIEKVTKTQVEKMPLPSVDDVNQARMRKLQTKLEAHASSDVTGVGKALDQLRKATGFDDATLAQALLAELSGGQALLLSAQDALPEPGKRQQGRPSRDAGRGEKPARRRRDEAGEGSARPPRPPAAVESGMERYRVEVGHTHGVKPGNLVGALANEAGLDAQLIGRIDLHQTFSLVDLPEGMPKPVFKDLKNVWVCGQKLRITQFDGNLEDSENAGGGSADKQGRPSPGFDRTRGKPPGKFAGKGKPGGKPGGKSFGKPEGKGPGKGGAKSASKGAGKFAGKGKPPRG